MFGRSHKRMTKSSSIVLFSSLLCALLCQAPLAAASDETSGPTPAPVTLIEEKGELVIVLLNVTSVMSPYTVLEFERDISTFMLRHFQQESGWGGTIADWTAKLEKQLLLTTDADPAAVKNATDGQRRRRQQLEQEDDLDQEEEEEEQQPQFQQQSQLQQHVRRSLFTQGLAPLVTKTMVTVKVSQSLSSTNFVSLIQEVVDNREAELLVLLKDSPSIVTRVYFTSVVTTETFAPGQQITTKPADFTRESAMDGGTNSTTTTTSSDDDGLSSKTIAGIAAAAGFVVILIIGILCVACRRDSEEDEELNKQQNPLTRSSYVDQGGSVASGLSSRYRSRSLGPMRSSSARVVAADGRTLSVKSNNPSEFAKIGDGTPESAPPRRSSEAPIYEDDEAGGEEEAYEEEYEVEGGYVEPAVQSHESGSFQEGSHNGGASTQPDFSMGADSIQKQQEDPASHVQVETPPQQQPLQQSQPLQQNGQAGSVAYSNQARQVVAPPGKLGIVIETTLEGPVVHKINEGSPLMGKVFEGELITAIDDVDTRAMSASAITNLMIRTADSHRSMTVRSSIAG
ncbi:hypothetical protein ACA910_022103 [Epithemia clementina (nom. ined.)]